ncbi:MAG TPA: pyruvate dehydrogenase complex E1 component subunit beta [Gaiella sp.]|nr:pyruvate dehydrogenase complex E1 component subunit beta [Gaiella sp.]
MSASAGDTQLVDVGMPRLSDSMEEATILTWLKRPGDAVARGEPLVEVETDKATMVYEAETAGVLEEIVVDDGTTAELGAVIARIRPGAADAAAPRVPATAPAPPPATAPAPPPASAPTSEAAAPVAEVEFRDAIHEALDEELARDERVFLFGEDVAVAGGVFAVTPGLQDKHGPDRVFDTPISELAMTGAAYGAAITGRRPVLEIMFGDFLALSMDTLINQASKYWYLTGGKQGVPLVIRSVVGGGGRFGAIHSQMPISWLLGITGLKIVAPATPADAKGLLKAAIRDDNPVVFLEHKRLYSLKGEVAGDEVVPLGRARIAREGSRITLVTAMKGVHDCLEAAEELATGGIDAEVVDLRTLRPLDLETVLASVAKTNRVAVVEEGPLTGGWAGELLALIAEHGLGELDDAWRIATPDTPIPYSPPLEDAHLPGPRRIVDEVRSRVRPVGR